MRPVSQTREGAGCGDGPRDGGRTRAGCPSYRSPDPRRDTRSQFVRPATALILHGRNQTRLDELAAALADAPASIHTVRADFSELAQVHQLADDITKFTDHISVLVNDAGVGGGEPDGTDRRLTADGHELRFAVNHLAAFALTRRLLPLLDRGAPARIVNVASIGQAPIKFDDLTLEHGYSDMGAYAQSKLAVITTGFVLARQLDPPRGPRTHTRMRTIRTSSRSSGTSAPDSPRRQPRAWAIVPGCDRAQDHHSHARAP